MQNLGLISILLTWAGLLFLIRKWKGNPSMTFSQHAAKTKNSQSYYFFLWLVCLPLFYWFMLSWFTPEFGFGLLFKVLVTLGSASLLVAAAVPETKGKQEQIHRISAFAMAYFMLPIVIMIGFSPFVAGSAKILADVFAAIMLAEILFLSHHKRKHPKMLYIQASYVAMFHIAIIAATYIY